MVYGYLVLRVLTKLFLIVCGSRLGSRSDPNYFTVDSSQKAVEPYGSWLAVPQR
jgi:hypothetical protein